MELNLLLILGMGAEPPIDPWDVNQVKIMTIFDQGNDADKKQLSRGHLVLAGSYLPCLS